MYRLNEKILEEYRNSSTVSILQMYRLNEYHHFHIYCYLAVSILQMYRLNQGHHQSLVGRLRFNTPNVSVKFLALRYFLL